MELVAARAASVRRSTTVNKLCTEGSIRRIGEERHKAKIIGKAHYLTLYRRFKRNLVDIRSKIR